MNIITLIKNKFKSENLIPDADKVECLLKRNFYECDVHKSSTWGCLNCGQLIVTTKKK